MPKPLDVRVELAINAPVDAVRAAMFDPRRDPEWMAAVTSVAPDGDSLTCAGRSLQTSAG